MEMDAIHVIANPHAANGRGERAMRKLRRRIGDLGVPVHIHETRAPGDAMEWARSFPADAPGGPILVVGGDGTLHEVANGLMDRDPQAGAPPIVLLAVGTGNDFNRMLRTSGSLDEVLELLENGVVREFDVGRVRFDGRERYFVNLLGVGLDVAVLQRRDRFSFLPGIFQYLAALMSALVTFRPLPTAVAYQGPTGEVNHLEGRTLLTAVTVGPCVGGGIKLSPRARPDDGLLDLFQVERLNLWEIARTLPQVIRGTQREGPKIHLRTLRSTRISRSDGEPLTFELDGELMNEETTRLEVDVIPAALMFLDRAEEEGAPECPPDPAEANGSDHDDDATGGRA